MARQTIRRFIQIIFDKLSAKKAEQELAQSMGDAGKKGGENFLREARKAFDRRLADLKNLLAKGLINQAEFKKQADIAARTFNQTIIQGMEKARIAGKLTDTEYLKLSRTLKRVGDDGAVAGGKMHSAFVKVGAAIGGIIAARFGIQAITRFLSESVQAAIQAEDSVTRLDSVLRPLGRSYAGVADEVETYLTRLQKTTRFSDEDGREALVNLVTATGDYQLSLRLLDVTAKIAEKRQITMAEAAKTAADASKGLTKGMRDLGISTKDTGDIVAKIDRNLGNLAEEGAKKGSGAVAQLNNLWSEFQEKIGLAIIGSDGFKDSLGPKGLLGALTALNDWAANPANSAAISGFVDKLATVVKGVARVSKEILTFIPNPLMIAKGIDLIRGKAKGLFDDVMSGSSTTVESQKKLTREQELALEEAKRIREQRAKELAGELERIERDLAVKTLMIQQGLTEALARKMVERAELLKKAAGDRKAQAALQAGFQRQDDLDTAAKVLGEGAGEDRLPQQIADVGVKAGSAIPPIQEMTRELFIQKTLMELGASTATKLGQQLAELAGQQFDNAQDFSSPWVDGLALIRNEVEGQGTLFRDLGEAWAEGGIIGLAKLAAAKVKENVARAIEEGAKALGSLFFNPAEAAAHAKSAALHGAAAVAWKVAGTVAGGGGGGASSTGGLGATSPNLARGESMQPPGPEVHIHFKGPSVFNPQVQKAIYASQQEARQKYGDNAKITVHRDN